MFYICIWNIFLLIGCAKTEMVSEDNTVTNENIVTTTGTIAIETEAIETEVIETEVIETETQDAIQPSTDQPPEDAPEYKIIMGYTASHSGGGKLPAAGWKLRL